MKRAGRGPTPKQFGLALPSYTSTLLVPAHFSKDVLPAISPAGLFIGHTIPSTGGMVSYFPIPLPAVSGNLFVVAEFCADGESEDGGDPLFSLHWRWLATGGVSRELYTEPLAARNIQTHRIQLPAAQVTDMLSFTSALRISPISTVPMLLRAAWLEVRTQQDALRSV